MLKSWQVGHFKSISRTRDLGLADVTVLTGLHNAGKSSLLQSILLISQTLSSHATERTLLPDGPLVQFNTLSEIVSDYSDRTLTFGFELSMEQEKPATFPITARSSRKSQADTSSVYCARVTVDFHLDRIHSGMPLSGFDHTHRAAYPSAEEYFYMRRPSRSEVPAVEAVSITLPASDTVNEEIVFAARQLSEQEISSTQNLSHTQYYSSDPWSHEGKLSIDSQQTQYPYRMLFLHFLPGQLMAGTEMNTGSQHLPSDPASRYSAQIEKAVKQAADFFSNQVRYLGPKRVNPATAYMFVHGTNLRVDDVGSQGEFAAAVYQMHVQRATLISWYNPASQKVESGTLDEAVNSWLQYLEVAYSVECHETGDSLSWQVVYQKGQPAHPLAAHGLAVKQVLPLLVMGLLAPKGSLLLFEHPELSLHQRAQARLGDFFVGLAACHKQCLIETQSENLVTQLRYHIVRDGGHDPDKYMIYYVDRDDEGATQFTPVEISPRGNILNWPEGFFDETSLQEEKISIAYLRRKTKAGKHEQPR